MKRTLKEPSARFWAKVDKSGSCWIWTAGRLPSGYGTFFPGNGVRHALSHRWIYEHLHGPIAPGMVVMHKCDNPSCVNPDHLTVGTQKDNLQDASAKGRMTGNPHFVPARGVENHSSKLTEGAVREMRIVRAQGFSWSELGARYGVDRMTARDACLGKTWAHVAMTGGENGI